MLGRLIRTGSAPKTSSLLLGADLAAARSITRPETDIVLVRRQLTDVFGGEAARLCDEAAISVRHEFPVDGIDADELFPELDDGPLRVKLRRDVLAIARCWGELTGRRHAVASLAIIADDQCRKLHCDYVGLRVLCTYHGPGTWLAPEHAVDRSKLNQPDDASVANGRICPDASQLVQAQAGDVVFLKGKAWPRGARGAVHRSPSLDEGSRRLLLKLDGSDCGC